MIQQKKPKNLNLLTLFVAEKNILNRMKTLIHSARKEITAFVPDPSIMHEIGSGLTEAAEKRRVKLDIATTQDINEETTIPARVVSKTRVLCCPFGLLISDIKTLLIVSNWTGGIAILTQDPALVTFFKEYYENMNAVKENKNNKKLNNLLDK